jgi:hypothetical protein
MTAYDDTNNGKMLCAQFLVSGIVRFHERCVYTIEQSADIAALLGANLSNTRRANSSSIDFAR